MLQDMCTLVPETFIGINFCEIVLPHKKVCLTKKRKLAPRLSNSLYGNSSTIEPVNLANA